MKLCSLAQKIKPQVLLDSPVDTLLTQFLSIDQYLAEHAKYWRFCAFELAGYPEFEGAASLWAFLDNIDDKQLALYQQQPQALYPQLVKYIPSLLKLDSTLFGTTSKINNNSFDAPFWLKTGIKGRKWQQIESFAEKVQDTRPVLEWCAGKGHLGRLIHLQTQAPVTSVEWNGQLCEQGLALAKQLGAEQRFQQADVLKGEADLLLQRQQHAVALHACGDLHIHLIKQAVKQQTERLTISPCCYHLIEGEVYQPVSKQVKENSLLLAAAPLAKQMLKFAVAKQGTSGERQKRLNDQEVWWRLSFDCLQKQLLNSASYLNIPSFPKALLSTDFRQFAAWVIQRKQLNLQLPDDLSGFLAQGEQRFKRLRRLELVTQFFQRPLELWLVLDRALSLQEAGYQVQLSSFCDISVTPRNLLIQAARPS